MPPHITALLIPFLIVVLDVQRVPDFNDDGLVPGKHCPHHESNVTGKPGDRLSAAEAATVTAAAFFDPVILLFLGGFTMAAALDKYGVSERLAVMLLSKAGKRPSRVLLVIMTLCVFLSMWVSNVAAAVLNSAIMLPLLRSLPPTSGWPKMVLLGIAYACNIGGMATPIASPQNVIALTALKTVAPAYGLSFLDWMLVAVPICVCATLVCWLWLRWYFKTGLPRGIQTSMIASPQNPGEDATPSESTPAAVDKGMGWREWYIVGVVAVTVVLWCIFDNLEEIFGNMGIVALIPVLALYGPSLLTKQEFDSTPWSVLILMGGGLALGNGVKSSGLLKVIADGLGSLLAGQSLFVVALTFNAFAGILANFISSTVSAIIMLPIIAQVGLSIGHPRSLVVGATIMCSGAMGLPVSSFPNANAMGARKSAHSNEAFLSTSDFSKTGFPMAFFMLVLVQTVGYALFVAFGW
jgi:anion transporter